MVDYLIVANSGRAIAASAKQAGYKVSVADCFVDEDTKSFSESFQQLQYSDDGFNAEELLSHVENIISRYPDAKLVYGSGFESNPELLEKIGKLIPIYGNSKETVVSVKDPVIFFGLLDRHGIHYPDVIYSKPAIPKKYLVKRIGGIGGNHVNWSDQEIVDINSENYYQKFIPGAVSSVVFLANGERAKLVGFNRQLQTKEFIDMPFLYQGAISLNKEAVQERDIVKNIVSTITRETGLKGLCGLDYIIDEEEANVLVLEVNPRPPGTFELHEGRQSLFDAHIACFEGGLPESTGQHNNESGFRAYAILYAKEKLFISDKVKWPGWVKDRPTYNNNIEAMFPVCTVYAEENSIDKVKTILFNRLHKIESIIVATQNET